MALAHSYLIKAHGILHVLFIVEFILETCCGAVRKVANANIGIMQPCISSVVPILASNHYFRSLVLFQIQLQCPPESHMHNSAHSLPNSIPLGSGGQVHHVTGYLEHVHDSAACSLQLGRDMRRQVRHPSFKDRGQVHATIDVAHVLPSICDVQVAGYDHLTPLGLHSLCGARERVEEPHLVAQAS